MIKFDKLRVWIRRAFPWFLFYLVEKENGTEKDLYVPFTCSSFLSFSFLVRSRPIDKAGKQNGGGNNFFGFIVFLLFLLHFFCVSLLIFFF